MTPHFMWIKWFWKTLWCNHKPGTWYLVDCGMRKVRDCTKCGICIGETLTRAECAVAGEKP